MTEQSDTWEADDLVELRVRGEYVDLVGLLSTLTAGVIDADGTDNVTSVARDLADQATQQVNFGKAEKQLKRQARQDNYDYRGIDVRIHEFDPRHPDEQSEMDVNDLPPLEEANTYAIVMQTDEGLHMVGYPDELDTETGLHLSSALRIYARDIEDAVTGHALEEA